MTIKHMKIFLQVYRTQNMTRAAEQLHMTQPAVTRAIREIEDYYGVCLFERFNRRLSVTEVGKEFYSRALHIADGFDSLERTLRNWGSCGTLRVGASITLGNFVIPQLVKRFEEEYPNIKIKVTISNGALLQKALIDNLLDIAMIEGSVGEAEFHTEVFQEDHLVLIVPPGHGLLEQESVGLKDLCDYPFLMRERGSAGRTLLDHVLTAHDMEIQPKWESVSTQAIVKAVACGIGISILPKQLVSYSIEHGSVCTREIVEEDFHRYSHLVWHKNKYLTDFAKQFIAMSKTVGMEV